MLSGRSHSLYQIISRPHDEASRFRTSSKIGGGCAARQACLVSQRSGWFETRFSAKIYKMQAPPLWNRKGSPGTGDKLGKVLFGQSQKEKSGRNLIMVRQNFNFIYDSGDPPSGAIEREPLTSLTQAPCQRRLLCLNKLSVTVTVTVRVCSRYVCLRIGFDLLACIRSAVQVE